MINVRELKGYKSLRVLNVFHTLMLGLKQIPEYRFESYESFFGKTKGMTPQEKETLIREAVLFVTLEPDEVEAVIGFVCDPNGVPYGPENIKNLGPDELHEAIVAVCLAVSGINITLVSEAEKKNSRTGHLTPA